MEQKQPTTTTEQAAMIAAAREIMGLQKYCALVTLDSSGHPRIRAMNPFPPEHDMTVWMATNSRSRKVEEIRNCSRVCLYYADHQEASGQVILTGKAVLVTEMSEILKRKRDYWEQAFPDWTYLILIKVVPEELVVLNYQQGLVNDAVTWQAPSLKFDKP
ncbi:pyridoxamine 5'-phosphate oxidase [Anaerolineae bacterium]|nr:pyridoxamine 5'-phosphate oxidase [Anaerolineae bacterium]